MPASTSSLSSKHHTLIQALLSRGPLKESEFRAIFHEVTGKSPANQVFNDYLSDINDELSYVQLELRKCLNQYDGKAYYGVINTISDDHSKLGTKYSVPQIALYKGILEAIVQDMAGEGSISNIDALNIRLENQVLTGMDSQPQDDSTEIPSALKNFSMSQKDKTIEELVCDQWLCSISDGRIGLGVRSFLDLRSWFHENEVPTCQVCNEAAVKAEFCQNENCNTRIHQSCLKKLFSLAGVKGVCPACGKQWRIVAERAATEEQEADDQDDPCENMSQPDPSIRKRRRTSKAVGCNTQESDSTLTSLSLSASRRLTRSSTRHAAA